jgi:asparagine N-glycosylation enzyme membrane subunit Stt3
MSFTKDFARGCLIDFLVAVAAMILLGCWYWGFSVTLLVIVAVWLALAGLMFIPWEEKKQDSR